MKYESACEFGAITLTSNKHIPLRLILHSSGNNLPASVYKSLLNDSNPVTNTTFTPPSSLLLPLLLLGDDDFLKVDDEVEFSS